MKRKMMKYLCTLLSVVLLLSIVLCGCDDNDSRGNAAKMTAEDFISSFEKAGYKMTFDSDYVEDLQEEIESIGGIEKMVAYTGDGEESVSDSKVESYIEFYYVKCADEETAITVYDALMYEMMPDDIETIYSGDHKEKARGFSSGYNDYYGYYQGSYFAWCDTLSRNKNIVVFLEVDLDVDTTVGSSVLYTTKAMKAVEKLGF